VKARSGRFGVIVETTRAKRVSWVWTEQGNDEQAKGNLPDVLACAQLRARMEGLLDTPLVTGSRSRPVMAAIESIEIASAATMAVALGSRARPLSGQLTAGSEQALP